MTVLAFGTGNIVAGVFGVLAASAGGCFD